MKNLCESIGLKGRVLVANKGINGAVSGEIKGIEAFKKKIKQSRVFSNLTFREQAYPKQTYHKLVVKVREEVVSFGRKVDLKNTAKHISPKVLKTLLDNGKDVVLLDARNQYETKVGKFKGALTMSIENFRDFSQAAAGLGKLKTKKIVMYCTGGVRCEKASAFLKERGFGHVSQLEGGIINFVNKFPNTYFEGSCFVFDDRLVSSVSENKISRCEICGVGCDEIINCFNLECDKLFISCMECQKKMGKSCSDGCKNSIRRRGENLGWKV